MKQLFYIILTLVLLTGLAACGGGGDTPAGGEESGGSAEQSGPTPTKIILETPTPKLAPPTPTPKPSPTPSPTPEPVAETETTEGEGEGEATEAAEPTPTPEPVGPMLDVEMVLVPAGPFTMGSDSGDAEDAPAQTIDLPAFEIDKFEVTNDDFALFVGDTGYVTTAEAAGSKSWKDYATDRGNHPVVKVTWNDAVAFCEWAEKRLPTEQEWEKAARGDDGRSYPWGNDFDSTLANVKDTGLRSTTAVGSFPGGATVYGAEDMGGNVWEWTASWFKVYDGGADNNPYYGEKFRVTRGGAWFEEAAQLTTFNRNAADPEITANDDLGFRCARDAQ